MSLDDRIARDAERRRAEDHAPSFDDALERAVAPRGSARTTWPAVACVIALVAAVVAVFAVRGRSDNDAPAVQGPTPAVPVSLPSPHTITRDGHTYTVALKRVPLVVEGQSSSTVVAVPRFDTYDPQSKPWCNYFNSSARVVAQDSRSVTIALFRYEIRRAGNYYCSFSEVVQVGRPTPTIKLALSRPLGDRVVIDALSGKVVGAFGTHDVPPAAAYLPTGYRQSSVEPLELDTVGFSMGTRTYSGPGGATISVNLESASVALYDGSVVARDEVAERPATVRQTKRSLCVSWARANGWALEVCSTSSAKPSSKASSASPGPTLPVAELLKIARSLKSP